MQNRHHQLIRDTIARNWSLAIAIVLLPLILTATIPILPTFDDWTSLVSPSFAPFFTKERFLFYGYHWRPFDSIFGYIVGRNPQLLFPMLNHVCVVLGHLCCTFLVFKLSTRLHISNAATNLATLFFFVSPGMVATVTAVDGLNQTYANLFALTSTLLYMSLSGYKKYIAWLGVTFIATLCKENALMWALIAPILSFSFHLSNIKRLRRDLMIGSMLIIFYFSVSFLLPNDVTIHPDYIPSFTKTLGDIPKFLLSTWFAVDFISLLHQPSRNLLIAAITIILSVPLLFHIFIKNIHAFQNRQFIGLIACHLLAVAPHLLTVYSLMHTYAGLAIAALIVGYTVDCLKLTNSLKWSFLLFIISAVAVDVHLWHASYLSSLTGKRMAQEVIRKSTRPANRVFVISIEDEYPRLSSFCVPPSDAFGWGIAVQHETNYEWPTEINDTIIERNSSALNHAHNLTKKMIKSNRTDCVWIVNNENIEIIQQ